jgi:hypothetical protein
MWPNVQVRGQIGSINSCFDKGHERGPMNMIRKLKIQRMKYEMKSNQVLASNGVKVERFLGVLLI